MAHCAFEYVGGAVMCFGPSMELTIQNLDAVFAENLSWHFYGIQRGDRHYGCKKPKWSKIKYL